MLTDLFDVFGVWFGLSENFKRGQALQAVEKVGGETAESLVLALGDNFCAFADHNHEEGDQRPGNEQHETGKQVKRKNKNKNAKGNKCCDDKLWQILTEIGVQRFDAFHSGGCQFASTFGAGVGGPQFLDMGEEPFTQVRFDAHGHSVGPDFVQPGQQSPASDDEQHDAQQVPDLG